MESREKPDLGQESSSVTAHLESKPSENASQVSAASLPMKQHKDNDMSHRNFSTAAEISSGQTVQDASCNISLASNEQQSIPSAASAFSSTVLPNATCGLEPSSALHPAPLAIASSSNMVPSSTTLNVCAIPASVVTHVASLDLFPPKHNAETEGTCAGQPVLSAAAPSFALPSSMALASDGSHAQQVTPPAVTAIVPTLPSASSALESGLMGSHQGEKPWKKEKIRKRPRQLLQDARACDARKSSEKQPVIRWKDVWVAQLIHIRGRMHSTFTNPQRQRVDLWQIVKHEMTNSCYGFDKDSEACRKKWIRVYKEYKDDLHLSSDEKSQKCRFYDLVDFYMGPNRANGAGRMPMPIPLPLPMPMAMPMPVCPDLTHNAKESMVPPLTSEGDVKVEDGGPTVPHANSNIHTNKPASILKKPPLAKRPRMIEKLPSLEKPPESLEASIAAVPKKPHMKSSIQTMLSELVNIGKELLQTTREFEKEKLAVLHSIKDTLGKIAKKI